MSAEKKRVMIVDDEEGIREFVTYCINKSGHDCVEFDSGDAAVEGFSKDDNFDLVVTDVRMPGEVDGINLLDKIKERKKFRPIVILMTGYGDFKEEEVYDKGAYYILRKPFRREELVGTIDWLLKDIPRLHEGDFGEVTNELNVSLPSIKKAQETSTLLIGQGGIYVSHKNSLRLNDVVHFKVDFTEGDIKSIEGHGIVISKSVDKNGVGIKYLNMTEELEKKLHDYVRQNQITAFVPFDFSSL